MTTHTAANDTTAPTDRTATRLLVLALLWTVAVGTFWAFAPFGSTSTSSSASIGPDGAIVQTAPVTTSSSETLLEHEGTSLLIVLAVPIALPAVALLARRSRHGRTVGMTAGILLSIGCLLGAMSVGLPYVPAAALLIAGASNAPRPVRSPVVAPGQLTPG